MKEIDLQKLKITEPVKLEKLPTSLNMGAGEEEVKKELKQTRRKLADWQDKLYAHNKYSVLVCLQGMDTSGKDSLIREVFKGFNSRGVVVHSFKTPTSKELKHDFLWRHYCALPERGKFGVFNRTHYENVLITKVHPEYILKERLPGINSVYDIDKDFWEERYKTIRNFEEHVAQNGTIIFKFFLNISKEEQRQRLLRRLRKPNKNWKFSPGDLEERKVWNKYRNCYEEAMNKTSRENAPWYVIPADSKPTARYLVAKIMLDKLLKYEDVQEPSLPPEFLKNLEDYRQQLEKE
ncbi:polyphosphate kinase 2 family protein [Salegentibacter sp. F188]|uniref:Polyphosphate kinase 2 family protein n=1 Tax=Autumnicola patrickiae TaxID=3075591 RepID=A0ABU3E0N7_9FLAO|nr:PPK2 family polyphosphate kinase [Salegentibacter sp. F188]MDT0689522.1 polyphosphate kinase 2 family protein [Salegentibacter sp. F188]